MNEILTQLVFQSVAMGITAALIPGLTITSIFGPVLMVVGITAVNSFFWDSALFFAIPNDLTSQTFSLLAVNAILFWILVKVLPGIESSGILPVIAGPIVFTVVGIFVQQYGHQINWSNVIRDAEKVAYSVRDYFQSTMKDKLPSN